jgi:adenylate cyclase
MSVNRIALRPFENLSGDPSQDVLARGLGLDLATELSRFATLEVIPPTSVVRLLVTADSQGGATPLFVLAGGVRRIEQRIRISAR